MRPAVRLLLFAAALLAVPLPARAEQFRYRYLPGNVVRTRAGLAGAMMVGQPGGQMAKMQFRVSLKQTQRVLSATGGIVTIEMTDLPVSGKMTAGGSSQAYPKTATKSIVRMTDRGKFLSRKSVNEDSGSTPGMEAADALYGLNFPDRDLKPGDTWQDTLTVGGKQAPQQVTVSTKYLGKQLFRGKTCAKFYTTVSMPLAMGGAAAAGNDSSTESSPSLLGRTSGSVTTYFDPKAGLEVYSTGSLTVLAKADLTSLSPEAGQFATVSKINMIQSLAPVGDR